MTYTELAAQYNISEGKMRNLAMNFLQSEGYLDTGQMCETLDDYVRALLKPACPPNESEGYIQACQNGKITGANWKGHENEQS